MALKLIAVSLFLSMTHFVYPQILDKQNFNHDPGMSNIDLQEQTEFIFSYTNSGNGVIHVAPQQNFAPAKIPAGNFSNSKGLFPYFDLRLIGVVTPVKDQILANGPGWAFATIGAIESAWLRLGQGSYDLSEKNLVTCHGFDYNVCTPGNYEMATAYMTRAKGPVSEHDNPYTGTNCNSTCSLFEYVPVSYVSDARFLPGDSATIRQALLDHGGIATLMYFDNTYYNSVDHTYYYSGSNQPNHGVLIVGWDDNKITAGGFGAWIVKNSRGVSWGEDGYFYVSYNDSQFLSSNAIFPVKNDWAGNSSLYYYDKYGWIKNTGYSNSTGYAVVKYVAPKNHMISKLGTYATSANTILDFEVYEDFDGTNFSNFIDSINNRFCPYPGYYTFDLDSAFPVNQGDDFYIKVKYNSPGATMPIPLESNSPGYVSNATIETNKCWISDNGAAWTAIGNGTAELSDLCIKAYGVDTLQPIANFTANKTSIYVGESVNFINQSTGNPSSYSWTFYGGTPASSNAQNPTNIVYNNPGTYHVKLSISSINGTHSLTKYFYIEVNVVPPVALFTSSETVIAPGNNVDFTDLSEGNPTSWSWSFPGGSPATSTAQNPANIVYNNPGTYNVILTITNPLGSRTLTKYNYINVIPNGACGTLSHRVPSDSSVNYTFIGTGVWGYIAGHNSYGMTQYADRYENTSDFYVRGLYVKIAKAFAATPASAVTFRVWNENVDGKPGALLYSKAMLVNNLNPSNNTYNYIPFDSLFPISGNYFVGFDIYYNTLLDTVVNNVMMNRPNTFNTAYLFENGIWKSFFQKFGGGLGYTSLDIMVDICISPPTPFPYNVTGGGSYCIGGVGVEVGIDGSQTDASYELFHAGIPTGMIIQGTGNPISFGLQTAAGSYTVVGTNANGQNTMNGNAVVTIDYPPVADFVANNTLIAVGDLVNFTDLSTNNPTSWSWTFYSASPGSSLLQNPSNIQYNTIGFFDVSLTATNACGSDQIYKANYIEVMPGDSLMVYGYLTYDNLQQPQTPLNNVKVFLYSYLKTLLDSTITDINGYYLFDTLAGGTSYIIEPDYNTKPWGGSNSSDALQIMLHFVGMNVLSGLPLRAADVSADGSVNSIDALNVQQRFVGMIPGFVAGNWVQTSDTIYFNGANQQRDIQSLCYGDPNRSYIPPLVRSEAGVVISYYDHEIIKQGESFSLPVRIETNAEIGAISLIIDYDDNILKVNDVMINGSSKHLIYNTLNSELKISWFNITPMKLATGDIILSVNCELINENINPEDDDAINRLVSFDINSSSVFGDAEGKNITGLQISIPKIKIVDETRYYEFALDNNYPNPFSNTTEITYSLPYPGTAKLRVFNLLGETVEVLINQHQSAGKYHVIFNGSNLRSGIYYYMLEFESAGDHMIKTRKMMIK